PHAYADSELADRTPVWLSMTALSDRDRDVLLLLDDEAVPDFGVWFGRFERVIEIVSNEEEDRARARGRFKGYRDSGSAPGSHEHAHPPPPPAPRRLRRLRPPPGRPRRPKVPPRSTGRGSNWSCARRSCRQSRTRCRSRSTRSSAAE